MQPGLDARGVRVYRFGGCRVEVDTARSSCTTIFPDGTAVPARPQVTRAYRGRAARLGYAADAGGRAACSREHELLHTWLAEKCGRAVSPTLWAVAHRQRVDRDSAGFEEDVVLAFQRFLNTGRKGRGLRLLVWLGHDLAALRQEALALLRF
jgi:hypothetical protein